MNMFWFVICFSLGVLSLGILGAPFFMWILESIWDWQEKIIMRYFN